MKELTTGEEVISGEIIDPPFIFWKEWVDEIGRDQVHHFHLQLRSTDMKDLSTNELKRLQAAVDAIKEVVSGCILH